MICFSKLNYNFSPLCLRLLLFLQDLCIRCVKECTMGRRVSFVRKRQQPTLLHLLWGFKCPKVKVWTQNHIHSFGQIHLHFFFQSHIIIFCCKQLQKLHKNEDIIHDVEIVYDFKKVHFYCSITHCSKLKCCQKSFHIDSISFEIYF